VPREAEFIHGDVRDPGAVDRALRGVEAVFHLAAYQDYLPDFSTFAFINDGGTAMLYERIVAGRLPVRKIVVASSQAAYGEGRLACPAHGAQHPDPRPEAQLARGDWEVHCPECGEPMRPMWTDEARVNPANPYAVSKVCQELYGFMLGKRYGIPTAAMRYSITQGPRQSFRNAYSGVLRIFTVRLLSGLAPVLYEDGAQLRDYVSVYDVARANLLILEDERADYRAFNVGGGRRVTVREYAELIGRLVGREIAPETPGRYRFGDTRHSLSDISGLRALGWEPQVSLRDIAAGYIAWAQTHPEMRDYSVAAEKTMVELGTVRAVRS
jgi:dTDP-L-rhamnose 4-epimerase